MRFKTSIKIKRKGFNYYRDYINKYFEEAFSRYGFHLVKNPEQSEYNLFMYFDDSPWLTIVSKKLDDLDEKQLGKLSEDIAVAFKTITKVEPFNLTNPESITEFHFSSKHSAYEEPPFITEGATILKWLSCSNTCQNGEPFIISCLNYGGISRGLEIIISGDFVENDTVNFNPIVVHSYEYMGKGKKELTFTAEQQKITRSDGRKIYLYDFADFVFPEGINQFSTKLFAKKGDTERHARSLYLYMIPIGKQRELDTICISILPKSNRNYGVHWYNGIPMNFNLIK